MKLGIGDDLSLWQGCKSFTNLLLRFKYHRYAKHRSRGNEI